MALHFWRKATQCIMPNSAKNPVAQPPFPTKACGTQERRLRRDFRYVYSILFPQKRVRWERQLEQAFGRTTFPFCRKAKQESRPSAVKPPATHNLLPAKTCKLLERTVADFRAHGIALLAESNAVHNAEQCKKSGRTVSFSHKSVWEKERRLRRDFRYVVQYPFPAKACEMGAAIVTGFRAHNVSFLPQSKAEIQSLRRKTSGHE